MAVSFSWQWPWRSGPQKSNWFSSFLFESLTITSHSVRGLFLWQKDLWPLLRFYIEYCFWGRGDFPLCPQAFHFAQIDMRDFCHREVGQGTLSVCPDLQKVSLARTQRGKNTSFPSLLEELESRTVVCFKSPTPMDEEMLLLLQTSPERAPHSVGQGHVTFGSRPDKASALAAAPGLKCLLYFIVNLGWPYEEPCKYCITEIWHSL